jgi:hypothetical protein
MRPGTKLLIYKVKCAGEVQSVLTVNARLEVTRDFTHARAITRRRKMIACSCGVDGLRGAAM